jgi:hypothetical protein
VESITTIDGTSVGPDGLVNQSGHGDGTEDFDEDHGDDNADVGVDENIQLGVSTGK